MYAYHATIFEFLPSIKEYGLKANFSSHLEEDVIFVEPDYEEAAIYLEKNQGVMLRFLVEGIGHTKDGECVLWNTPEVSAKSITFEYNKNWLPLSQFDANIHK